MVNRRINPDHVHLVRYADDFIVTASSVEILHRAKARIREFLAERGLELSEEKTSITHIDAGFDFLGQHIKRYNSKLVIQPARKNVHTFLLNIRRTIKRLTSAPALEVIDRLTPMIRGWALYHRHISAAETFQFVDHEIQGRLWRWAKRRHSHRKKATGWDKHHLTPKYMGAPHTDENLVSMHPDCHIQVHHENLHIPAPPRRPSGNRVGVRSAGAG